MALVIELLETVVVEIVLEPLDLLAVVLVLDEPESDVFDVEEKEFVVVRREDTPVCGGN